jgi:DNA-binding response OmpR family regulator
MNNSKRILLVVDDEPDITLTFSMGLEDSGFEVDAFNDPVLALEAFKEQKKSYALALVDIKMPKMNGFELYRKIRKIDDKVKVCFLTALSDLQDYNAFKKEVFPKLGERYFVQKPIDNQDLINRVNNMINSNL